MNPCLWIPRCLSFIPRLVVHKEEIERIFHPEKRNWLDRQPQEAPEDQEDDEQDSNVEVAGRSIFLRGAIVPDINALATTISQLAMELPDHMRTAPTVILKLATELPSRIASLPSTLANAASDIPTTIISFAEGVEGTLDTIVQVSSSVAREVVELPHRASFEWKQLIWVLSLLVFAPVLIFGLVFFIPMNSVNEGVHHNRSFIYGTMTFYQMLTMAPWIETCNFAMANAQIPIKARLVTLISTVSIVKIYEAALAEGLFGKSVFPIPFSIVLSGVIGVSFIIPILYRMTPTREKADFRRTRIVLFIYLSSLIMVMVWAVGIQRLQSHPKWQAAVTFLYGPLRFLSKILIAAPVTTRLNPNRWIQLNLVLDILYTRVQVATFPFIDSYITLLMLFSTEVLTLAWRYYNGIDRLALWWNATSMASESEPQQSRTKTLKKITRGCFRAPISHIAQLNLTLRGANLEPDRIVRTLTGETAISFEDDQSNNSEGSELDNASESFTTLQSEPTIDVVDIEAACDAIDLQIKEMNGADLDSIGLDSIEISCDIVDQQTKERHEHELEVSTDLQCISLDDSLHGPEEQESNNLYEEIWEQRPIYHVVDSTGSNVISIIVRINQQLSIALVRNLPSASHLNVTFQISDDKWRKAQIFGWAYIALMLILLIFVGSTFFRRLQRLEGKKLSLSRVMSYLFKDHFWFFFLWLVSTGGFVCASMVNHFGADFSFRFKWLSCPGQIAWPSCPE